MAHNWKAIAKHTAITAGEIGVIGGSMIVTKKFLDARIIFQKQIAADPNYANKWYVKHQGAVKLFIGAAAACMIKNPWLKMVAIGVALEGFVTEARTLTTNKETGVSFFEQIGTATQEQIDQEMIEAAKSVNGFGTKYETTVGAFTDYGSTVGWGGRPSVDLSSRNISTVSGIGIAGW